MIQTSAPLLVEVSGVSFAYPSVSVFDRFSWAPTSPLSVVQGPSGCGKTTLLKLLAGHLEPQAGRVDCTRRPSRLVVQDDALFPWLSVDANLSLSPDWRGWGDLTEPLARIGGIVEPLRRRHAAYLSFGQRRIVELFRVLASSAQLLLLDEPLNFLDSEKRALVVDCLRVRAEAGTVVIVTTHYDADFRSEAAARYSFGTDLPVSSLKAIDR